MSESINELRKEINGTVAKLHKLQERHIRQTGQKYEVPARSQIRPGRMLEDFLRKEKLRI